MYNTINRHIGMPWVTVKRNYTSPTAAITLEWRPVSFNAYQFHRPLVCFLKYPAQQQRNIGSCALPTLNASNPPLIVAFPTQSNMESIFMSWHQQLPDLLVLPRTIFKLTPPPPPPPPKCAGVSHQLWLPNFVKKSKFWYHFQITLMW